ncbi:MAG TPA: DMT family transporter, partial [Candidatus Limnocylindria bacterium]|nr:DMT family transporter [Candidatus Limnocylindria bacterium]
MSASRTDAGAVGAGLIVLAAACFGTLGPLSRFAGDAGVEALSLVAWRDAIGAACVVAFLAVLGRPILSLRGVPSRERWMLGFGALANALLNLAIFVAFGRITIALALLLFYLYPAFVALASMLWFGDRPDALRWTALATSFLGVVLVVAGGAALGHLDPLGMALAFGSALIQAFYVLAARHGFASVPGPQAGALSMAGGAIVVVAIALPFGQAAALLQPLASLDAALPVLLAGTLGAGLPTVAFIGGIRLVGAPRGAILATLEPVVGV